MSYDLLFVASDSRHGGDYHPDDHGHLKRKYGLSDTEVQRLIFASYPAWTVEGVQMSYMAAENWFKNGRRYSLTQKEIEEFLTSLRADSLTRYGNGLYVCSHLLKKGHTVELVNNLETEWERFLEYVEQEPRVIALSTTFIPGRYRAEASVRRIREVAPDALIVVGGPLVFYSHKILEESPQLMGHPECKNVYFFSEGHPDPAVDAAIIDGRGEQTLAKLLERVAAGKPWRDLPNVAYMDGGRWTINPRVPETIDIDSEQVQWDRLDDKYLGREIAIRGSSGCPLRCKFCSFVVLHPEFDLKSVDVLRDELRRIKRRSDIVKHVSFTDDNLFLKRNAVDSYCKMMVDEDLPFTWSAFMRVDSITPENVKYLRDSGCAFLMLGIESGDMNVLKSMRKIQKPERVLEAIELLTDAGISTVNTMIVGFPGECEESVDNTIQLLNSYPDRGPAVHWYDCWINTVIPLTPADKQREKWNLEGIFLDWQHDTMNVEGAFRQRDRLLREVRKGGCYLGPYAFDSTHPFQPLGEAGFQSMRRFFKLRHRMACLDYWDLDSLDGKDRAATLDELEGLILGHARQLEGLEVRGEAPVAPDAAVEDASGHGKLAASGDRPEMVRSTPARSEYRGDGNAPSSIADRRGKAGS